MAAQQFTPTNGQLIDFYEVLQVSSTAPLDTIFDAYMARRREIDADTDLDLSIKAPISNLVNDAYKVLSNLNYRMTYDIIRLLNQGKISYELPPHDFPSRGVAQLRVKVALNLLLKTLNNVVKAYVNADNQYLNLESQQVYDYEDDFQTALDEMWVFCAHILIQIETCERAADFLANSASDGEWAWDIRDARTDSTSRKVLGDIQAAETRLHQYYWLQFSRALRKGRKDNRNPSVYSKRLVNALAKIRYANDKTSYATTFERAQEYQGRVASANQ